MTKRFHRQDTVDATPDELLSLLVDPDFQASMARQMGAIEARCTRENFDDLVVVTLYLETPPRYGSEPNRSTQTTAWRCREHCGSWKRIQHGHEERAHAEGQVRIVQTSAGRCLLVTEGEIEIRVPLLGRAIEKKIIRALEKHDAQRLAIYRDGIRALRKRRATN